MIEALAIFGAIHLVAYGLASFMFAFTYFINWFFREANLKRGVLKAYGKYLSERRDAERR